MGHERTVHVIDDDAGARDSLAFLLQAAGLSVRTYDGAAGFLEAADLTTHGCIVTDVRMPEIDGLALLRRLKSEGCAMPVIVMTGHGDVPLAVEAMKMGAADFFEKPYDDETLLVAVRGALDRESEQERREGARTQIASRLAKLSARERQVLEGLVAGKPNKIIAFDHDISPRTVEIYRANVMTKMGASSLSDLVRMAILGGVLDGLLSE